MHLNCSVKVRKKTFFFMKLISSGPDLRLDGHHKQLFNEILVQNNVFSTDEIQNVFSL